VALQEVYRRITATALASDVRAWRQSAAPGDALRVADAAGSLPGFLLRILSENGTGNHGETAPLIAVAPDEDAAAYLESDLDALGDPSGVLRFPATGQTPYDDEQIAAGGPLTARADALQQLSEGFGGIVVTSAEAIFEKVPPPEGVQQDTLHLKRGQEVAPEALVERLVGQGFSHAEFVEAPGNLARRGGILDVFPFAGEYPVRIEFFGDEIDALREFDPHTQRSVSRLTQTRLVPNLEREDDGSSKRGPRVAFFDYLPKGALAATFDEARLLEEAASRFSDAETRYADALAAGEGRQQRSKGAEGKEGLKVSKREGVWAIHESPIRQQPSSTQRPSSPSPQGSPQQPGSPPPATRYLPADALQTHIERLPRLLFGTFTGDVDAEVVQAGAHSQPAFGRSIEHVRATLTENVNKRWRSFILCDSQGQATRLRELLETDVDAGKARLTVESLHEGFELPAAELAVYTDHQIFGRYHRPSTKKKSQATAGLSLRDIQNLTPGDFVVHVDHGIGKFAGLKEITVREKKQEAVRLRFQGGDTLFVNTSALHKLSKFKGEEGHQPRLTNLNSDQWQRTKEKTKGKVKDIARDLIELYAKRKAARGTAFSTDTVWQREMEASFAFEDTPDQARATREVKEDMEAASPMDRLVCGDVGFGKTEIAVRAAFKAVQDGKQTAVLVPTTVLAQQHGTTFAGRLEPYPVRVESLSRFRTSAEQREVVDGLKNGTVDVVIGTHRITSTDVAFNDLGLVVIDEEQRFGVKTKERLREMRASVDTLTLTATPIPRTLQFSLLGARDLSIISTAPPNRQPIITEIHGFDKDLIRDAIRYEKSRGGQVFFIHNRVKSIREVAEMVRAMVPGVRVRVGHGQMAPRELEDVMLGFVEKQFDVLVSTTIIENGLDISNANTMILNRADRFGLSEMHQLRGRVGRSQRKAFCYLLVPSVGGLTKQARHRLKAIEEFSELGSGFSLAMRDLDIRGAGSLLGAQQSGFINSVGYQTYQRILNEAVQELRAGEFSETFDGEEAALPPAPDTAVDVEADALLPKDYVQNNTERLNLYRRISDADDAEALDTLREELVDRFGALPPEGEQLLEASALRLFCQQLRLPKVVFRNQRLFLYLPDEEDDPAFYEHVFHPMLERMATLDQRYVMKDTASGTTRAIVQDVPSLSEAVFVAEWLAEREEEAEAVAA
jgi:transcription-repair coupling factor (superfamily II helicase)